MPSFAAEPTISDACLAAHRLNHSNPSRSELSEGSNERIPSSSNNKPCIIRILTPITVNSLRSAFNIAETLRFSRLSEKLKESALQPKALTDAEEHRRKQDGYETEEEEKVEEPVEKCRCRLLR